MTFGEWLRERRTERGISRAKLARLAGVHSNTIRGWECYGHTPNIQVAEWVCTALGVQYVIGGEK